MHWFVDISLMLDRYANRGNEVEGTWIKKTL